MKKLMIIPAIAMAMTAGSAVASQQSEVKFFGNVTAQTCDVIAEVNGSVSNTIQLGTVSTGGAGKEIPLVFKAKNAQGDDCSSLTGKTATVSWSGALGNEGIDNQSGTATGAYVLLSSANANNDSNINKTNNSVQFDATKVIGDGLQFKAQLKGGSVAGDYQSAAAYAVTYQ
ncbi:fimbrial protein [Escherichia coli]|nr:fimbrial protein [Escherichia coli]